MTLVRNELEEYRDIIRLRESISDRDNMDENNLLNLYISQSKYQKLLEKIRLNK